MIIFDNAFLENLKIAIIKCNINKSLISKLLDKTENREMSDNSISKGSDVSSNIANDYNTLFNNNNDIEQFLYSIIPLLEKYIQNEVSQKVQNNSKDSSMASNQCSENFVENTLVVSEIQQCVILPYFISDLEELHKNTNLSYDEIIKQNYTLPISMFKSLSFSRFREGFKLARNKEKKSLSFSFNLGLELLFNYNLHPAIIAACRNLDELDIYLDCLDSGETDKFKCFNIKFEIPPILIKK